MKLIKFTPAILLLSMLSCEKNQEISTPSIENEPIVIRATSESSATRTALSGADFTEIVWQAGDAMNFYPVTLDAEGLITSKIPGDATLQQGIKLVTSGSGASVNFAAEDENIDITKATASDNTPVDATDFFALTPYLDNGGVVAANIKINKADGGVRPTIFFRMPAEQVYVENSFDPAVAFAFAKAKSITDEIKFENQFGVLRLNVKGAANQIVTSIEVTANDDAAGLKRFLTGFINACTTQDVANGKAIAVSGKEGETKFQTVTMSCGADGVALSAEATAFNVVLVPFTGITVKVNYTEDGVEKSLEKVTNTAIKRSALVNMPVLDITPEGAGGDQGEDQGGNNNNENLNPETGLWE